VLVQEIAETSSGMLRMQVSLEAGKGELRSP